MSPGSAAAGTGLAGKIKEYAVYYLEAEFGDEFDAEEEAVSRSLNAMCNGIAAGIVEHLTNNVEVLVDAGGVGGVEASGHTTHPNTTAAGRIV